MFGKKKNVRVDKYGVPLRGNVQSVSDWEPIPEAEKHKVPSNWHDGVQVFSSDIDAALAKAKADKKKRFR